MVLYLIYYPREKNLYNDLKDGNSVTVWQHPSLVFKTELLEKRFAKWFEDTSPILEYIKANTNYRTGWTAEEDFSNSTWEKEMKNQLEIGHQLVGELAKMMRNLNAQKDYFKEASDSWELCLGAISYVSERITIFEQVLESFSDKCM